MVMMEYQQNYPEATQTTLAACYLCNQSVAVGAFPE
jgi:hypothetical protein